MIEYIKKILKLLLLKFKYKTSEIHSLQISRDIILGNEVKIYEGVYIGHNCVIGDYSYINPKSYVDDNTTIGKYCSISREVIIGVGDHELNGVTTHPIGYSKQWNDLIKESSCFMRATTIGNDVWIGARAIILNGLTVGDGAVIGAGAVVTKDIPPYTIVAGVPAKELKKRRVKKANWWNLSKEEVKQMVIQYNDN